MNLDFRNQVTQIIGNPIRPIREVKAIDVQDQRCRFMPAGMDLFFPEVEGLQVANSELVEVQSSDMQQFPHLKQLFMSENKLQSLENDVFENCPHLEYLNLGYNNIMHMGTDIFKPLNNLQYANMAGNGCIDTKMESSNGLQAFASAVSSSCPPTQAMVKREGERKLSEKFRTTPKPATESPDLEDLKAEINKLKNVIAEHDQKITEINMKQEDEPNEAKETPQYQPGSPQNQPGPSSYQPGPPQYQPVPYQNQPGPLQYKPGFPQNQRGPPTYQLQFQTQATRPNNIQQLPLQPPGPPPPLSFQPGPPYKSGPNSQPPFPIQSGPTQFQPPRPGQYNSSPIQLSPPASPANLPPYNYASPSTPFQPNPLPLPYQKPPPQENLETVDSENPCSSGNCSPGQPQNSNLRPQNLNKHKPSNPDSQPTSPYSRESPNDVEDESPCASSQCSQEHEQSKLPMLNKKPGSGKPLDLAVNPEFSEEQEQDEETENSCGSESCSPKDDQETNSNDPQRQKDKFSPQNQPKNNCGGAEGCETNGKPQKSSCGDGCSTNSKQSPTNPIQFGQLKLNLPSPSDYNSYPEPQGFNPSPNFPSQSRFSGKKFEFRMFQIILIFI